MQTTQTRRTVDVCPRFVLLALVATSVASGSGCDDAAEPAFEALPIRDALRSTASAMAKQSATQRQQLAARLAEQTELDELRVAFDKLPSERVELADAQLLAAERDAWLFAVLADDDHEGAAYRSISVPELDQPTSLPLAEREQELEQLALETRAGRLIAGLAQLGKTTPVTRLVRAPQWPIALLLHHDTIYVNPAWLVALAEADAAPNRSSSSSGGGGVACTPSQKTPPPTPDVPELDGVGSTQKQILIEGIAAYYTLDSIQNSIDSCSDRCNDRCQESCDNACDNACDSCTDNFKCSVGAPVVPKRKTTRGEFFAMLVCLFALPALHRWRRFRARQELTQEPA